MSLLIAGLFRFLLSFVLIPSSDLCEHLIRILEGLGGQAGCHMCWALGSSTRVQIFWRIIRRIIVIKIDKLVCLKNTKVWFNMPNNGSYPNFGGFSQTFGVNAKILGFYT